MTSLTPSEPIVVPGRHVDTAIVTARTAQDVFVGGEIIRHRRALRLLHWSVAISFGFALLTGMPIWSPVFGWMATFVGGLEVARILHPYVSLAFVVFAVFQYVAWREEMRIEERDKEWFGPKVFKFMRYEDEAIDTGKYNGGQKMFFWAVTIGALALLVTGIPMWFPMEFSRNVRLVAIVLHNVTFIFFMIGVISHIYMGTAAEPGTFRSMTVGTVTRSWARLHHPGWFREVMAKEATEKREKLSAKDLTAENKAH
jgi:formate dehydrogenase subunit gamma